MAVPPMGLVGALYAVLPRLGRPSREGLCEVWREKLLDRRLGRPYAEGLGLCERRRSMAAVAAWFHGWVAPRAEDLSRHACCTRGWVAPYACKHALDA